jgi:hypothetical protein
MIKNQNGNVFVYILIAVGLLAALMFTLSKSADQGDAAGELSDGQNKIVAGEIIAYAASASNSLTQMQQTGATVDRIDFENGIKVYVNVYISTDRDDFYNVISSVEYEVSRWIPGAELEINEIKQI